MTCNITYAKITIDRDHFRPCSEDGEDTLTSCRSVSPDMPAMEMAIVFINILERITKWTYVTTESFIKTGHKDSCLLMEKKISIEEAARLTHIPLEKVRTVLSQWDKESTMSEASRRGIYAKLKMGSELLVISNLEFWYSGDVSGKISIRGEVIGTFRSPTSGDGSLGSHPTLTNPENKFVKNRIDVVMADALVGALTSIYTETNHTFEGYITDLIDSGHVFVTTQPKSILDELKANKLHNVFLEDIEFLLTAPKKKCK